MTDIATHLRIFQADPSDDFVEKRKKSIKELADAFKKRSTPSTILELAEALLGCVQPPHVLSHTVGQQVEKAIQKNSAAFVADGADLELAVCALLAAKHAVSSLKEPGTEPEVKDLLAASLWSGLSFQQSLTEPKLEVLRTQLIVACRDVLDARAVRARQRQQIAELRRPAEADPALALASVVTAANDVIRTLRFNAEMDREELNLLWWVLADWSELLDTKFSARTDVAAALAAGLEAAKHLTRLPAEAHFHLAIRNAGGSDELSLKQVIDAIGSDRDRLVVSLRPVATQLLAVPNVLPVSAALVGHQATTADTDTTRPTREWVRRAVFEGVITKLFLSKA